MSKIEDMAKTAVHISVLVTAVIVLTTFLSSPADIISCGVLGFLYSKYIWK
jgi:hypothetical protein